VGDIGRNEMPHPAKRLNGLGRLGRKGRRRTQQQIARALTAAPRCRPQAYGDDADEAGYADGPTSSAPLRGCLICEKESVDRPRNRPCLPSDKRSSTVRQDRHPRSARTVISSWRSLTNQLCQSSAKLRLQKWVDIFGEGLGITCAVR